MANSTPKQLPPFLIADDAALDFLNSVAVPWGEEIEWIANGRDLLRWLEHAKLVSAAELKSFKDKSVQKEVDKVATQARDLREWFRGFIAAHAGHPIQPSALRELDDLNRILARDSSYRLIGLRGAADQNRIGHGLSLQWRHERHWRVPEDLLIPVAEAMGDLICRVDLASVKKCEGPSCTLWFHDVSKNHTRRWCSMAVCGNRAKAAAHRAKKRENWPRLRVNRNHDWV